MTLTRLNKPELVAIILAISISISLVILTSCTMYYALKNDEIEPARLIAITQVLTGWGTGIVGVLGAYVGYSFGKGFDSEKVLRND